MGFDRYRMNTDKNFGKNNSINLIVNEALGKYIVNLKSNLSHFIIDYIDIT